MNDITRHHVGDRMSQMVIHNNTIYLAGQAGNRGDSVVQQTKSCLEQVDALVAEAGSDKTHILQATIWLAEMADFAEMNSVWDAWMAPKSHSGAGVLRSETRPSRVQG